MSEQYDPVKLVNILREIRLVLKTEQLVLETEQLKRRLDAENTDNNFFYILGITSGSLFLYSVLNQKSY